MLDHVSITVSTLETAATFYDAVMSALGHPCVRRDATALGYGVRNDSTNDGHTYLSVFASDAPISADKRHWCFRAPNRAAVDAFYLSGLSNGGTDDGAPALRSHYHAHYYAAFLLDPDGNRIEAVCHVAE